MKWFIDLPIRSKFVLGLGVVIICLIATIITATRGISVIQQNQRDAFSSEFVNATEVLTIKSNIDDMRLALLMMMTSSGKERDRWHRVIKSRTEEFDGRMGKFLEANRHEPPLLSMIEDLKRVIGDFRQTRDSELIPFIYANKTDAARRLALGVQAERYERMLVIIGDITKYTMVEVGKHAGESEHISSRSIFAIYVIGAITILAIAVIAIFSNRIIATPLRDLAEMARKVGDGDLTVKQAVTGRRDEVGMLSDVFHDMVERLSSQTKETREAITVLASSSNEIAATTAELASGMEETAVAVTETTSTVEEIKQTANVSSQKARHVADLSENASQIALNGSRLVDETIGGINNIREQMNYIADTIVRLSDHNQSIGEIISSVDDLAEQSNLLAVNASIEAAKAGEHGKGFVVVAQEIKSLAEQSKQATKQVRTILNDIQKASTTAVMATEKGSKAVEATVKQSAGTGDAIRDLARSIGETSSAITQISASNQQQLVGMDQVAMAMINIKQASSQNAASTKQVEVTIRNLQDLGQKLKKMAEYYKV